MPRAAKKLRSAVTLVELIVAMSISSLVMLNVGILLVSGQRAWQKTYNSAHHQIKEDAYVLRAAFGSVGRKANRIDYELYEMYDGEFSPVEPEESEEILYGDAVEFRYWDVGLDSEDSHELMDPAKTATAYALFYLDGDELKVDYGPYPPGGVPEGGGARNTNEVETVILARNVAGEAVSYSEDGDDDDDEEERGIFSHTVSGGVGQGCVRINVLLEDPESDVSTTVMTSALMRNIWPR